MNILYGGAFNPPTLAHFQIMKTLIDKFPNDKIIILPSGNKYKDSKIVDFFHRYQMVKILVDKLDKKIEISDYENKLEKFFGTYYTLKYFNNPYFVIGADQLRDLYTWINFENIVKENNFIVFPRDGINIEEVLNSKHLKEYKDHFLIIHFDEVDASSTDYRKNKNELIIDEDVLEYIKKNRLYEVL